MREIISRKQAIERGLKKYFTGRPCKNWHVSPHYISGQCVSCMQDRKRKTKINSGQYLTNRQKIDDLKFERELRQLERG